MEVRWERKTQTLILHGFPALCWLSRSSHYGPKWRYNLECLRKAWSILWKGDCVREVWSHSSDGLWLGSLLHASTWAAPFWGLNKMLGDDSVACKCLLILSVTLWLLRVGLAWDSPERHPRGEHKGGWTITKPIKGGTKRIFHPWPASRAAPINVTSGEWHDVLGTFDPYYPCAVQFQHLLLLPARPWLQGSQSWRRVREELPDKQWFLCWHFRQCQGCHPENGEVWWPFYVTGFLFLLPRLIIYYHELG